MKRQLFYFFLFMCLAFPLSTTAQVVDIPDSNLRAAVEEHLGKASGDTITVADMANLLKLEAKNVNISDLTGLEGATNLKSLRLGGNSISGIAPVTGLTNLKVLSLWTNSISDISPVEALTNLTELNLSGNLISDISPVADLNQLTLLHLQSNRISDIAALASLTNLTALRLDRNSISDISVLSRLIQLTELRLDRNSLTDLSPLVANTGLGSEDEVDVRRNPLNRASIQTHIPALQSRGVAVEFDDVAAELVDIPDPSLRTAIEEHLGKASGDTITVADMATLTRLEASEAGIRDLTGLEGATNLTRLDLGENAIRDISVLAGLTNLTKLSLDFNNITDISVLAGLPNLIDLALGYNAITDHSILSGLTNLTSLDLRSTNTSDLSVLSGLTKLERLYIDRNGISDLAPLAGLTNLTRLGLVGNDISDVSALVGLTNLKWMRLAENNITDLSPLVANTGLGSGDEVDVRRNPLNRASIQTHIPALQSRGVAVEFDDVVTELVDIPDPNLRAAIEEHLGKASGATITTADMANLTELFAYNINIGNLTGLEFAINLTRLGLHNNSISDISAVADLTQLTTLLLSGNTISDISPLAGLTNLTYLWIYNNLISDLSPLVANTGLGDGDTIDVWGNPLSDASIQTHIPALQSRGATVEFIQIPTTLLKISGTVTELDNLLIAEVRDNRNRPLAGVPVTFTVISGGGTLSVTSAMTDTNGRAESRLTLGPDTGTNMVRASVEGISESVTFSDVPELPVTIPDSNLRAAIESTLGVASGDTITTVDMGKLTELVARNLNITDLTGLEHATNLTRLDLGTERVEGGHEVNSNSVSDLSPLAGLINLTWLRLRNNSISDLSPLARLTNLTWLNLGGNLIISDISALSGLTNLEILWLYGNSISDLSPLAGLTNLTFLEFSNNLVSDLSPLAGLTNLTDLGLRDNSISDISPVAGLTNLTSLSLNNNSISDISPVAGLTNLTSLSLSNNSISDISPVAGLTNLTGLGLGGNSISDLSSVAGLTNLTFLILDNNSISDISSLSGLTNLTFLILADNSIVDLSPLVENTGLGERDWVDVEANPLSFLSIYTYIPALRSRGVRVDFDHQPPVLSGHTAPVVSVAFSRDGTLASGGQDGTVILWDAITEQPIATLTGHTASARSVAFSPDGSILASGSHDGTVILWDVATQQPKDTLTEHTAPVETVAFNRDGSTLASGSQDGTVILWDVDTGQPKDTIMGRANWVWSVAFSPDGTLAIGRNDGTVLLWDVATGQPKDTLTGHTAWVESVAFTRDGSTLASGSGDNTVILWDVATGRPIVILPGHTAGVNSVAFSPDGTMLASGSDDTTVRLWDAIIGQPIATLTGHTSWVRSVAFSPDGSTLASGSGDHTVSLWEIAPPPLEYTLSIPAGINLIHVPLKVTAVDGVAKTIESISDLYDALGGASKVIFLATHDSQTQQWVGYFGPADKGTSVDKGLTDDMGILASMIAPASVHLSGNPLGTNGTSTITVNQGLNLVGLPLNDSRIKRVSDLFTLDGIGGNVLVIILTDDGEFKAVGRVDDPGDISIVGGQSFILAAQRTETVTISGDGWTNTLEIAAAPSMALTGIEVGDTTPVLGLRGAVVDKGTGLKVDGFRVTVKNLSTRRAVTAVTAPDEPDYRLIIVDIETGRATTIGDTLEISAQSPNPFIGVEPLRYTVTAEDVLRSRIQLPELAAYEIPSETQLLANYPNPFNPETWIPYRLAEDAFVTLTIYNLNGQVVRTLDVGHQIAAVYESRSKAVYWDGRNQVGESVASGVYFYHLSAGDYSATRKMLIIK